MEMIIGKRGLEAVRCRGSRRRDLGQFGKIQKCGS